MRLSPERRLLIVGLTYSGKSYWANRELVKAHSPVAVWDPHKCYDVAYYKLEELPKQARRWGIAQPYTSAKEYKETFAEFCREAIARRPQIIIVDEVALLATSRASAEDELVSLATQSRHAGAALAIIAQRAYSVPITVRSQCSDIVSFQQVNALDIAAIERDTEIKPLECAAPPDGACKRKPCLKHLTLGEFFQARIR